MTKILLFEGIQRQGQGFEDKEYFIIAETDWSTNVTVVEMTASVFSDIHPSPVKSSDIASCILTDLVYFLHVAEAEVTADCIQTQ